MSQLNLKTEQKIDSLEDFQFEPIKGYPMLHWKGKRPFRSTQYYPAQLKEVHGEATDGWLNKIFWGDNLQVMSHLLKTYRGQVDLVYIDPPFDSKADYKKKISLKGTTVTNDLDDGPERFGLTWPGKRDCFRLIQEPSTGTLLPVEEESVNWDTTQNLFIEADNLEALKLLQKSYYGKVKTNAVQIMRSHGVEDFRTV